jgi:hypothetical protein
MTILICIGVFYFIGVGIALFIIAKLNAMDADQPYVPLRYCLASWLFTVLVALTFMEYSSELEAEIEAAILEDEFSDEIEWMAIRN